MKRNFRLLIGSVLLLLAALGGRAQTLSPMSVTANPSSALPGDPVTYTIGVNNGGPQFGPGETASFRLVATNIVTGATFTIPGAAPGDPGFQLAPNGGIVGAVTTNPTTGQTTPGTGAFTITATIPTQVTEGGDYSVEVTLLSVSVGSISTASYSSSSGVLKVLGKPDLQITSLTYPAGTSYVGGDVIPMSLTFTNNQATAGSQNIPYTPGINGHPAFVRIQVVLSSNPTYGDADDLQLTILDVSADGAVEILTGRAVTTADNAGNRVVVADGSSAAHVINWNQVLPGNFSGSYYVLAKIDSLNALDENDPPVQTVNGNNVWGGNTLNPSGTLINLLPSNFPATSLSSHATGANTAANGYSDNPSMSADGRYVAFASDATNLVSGDTNGTRDVFVYDSLTSLIRRLSVSQQGAQGNGASNNPVLSDNGRYTVFGSEANNLVFSDSNGFSDIFVVDNITGLISRVSVTSAGGQANNPSFRPHISEDGRYIVFESTATNLDATYTVTPGMSHIYLHDRDVANTGTFDTPGNISTRLVDVDAAAPAATAANASSIQATISADGALIGFASRGSNLVAPATTAGRQHVYVRPRADVGTAAGNTKLVSVADATAAEGDNDSQTPSLSEDGRYIAFASLATNLVAGDNNGVSDVFVYDNTAAVGAPDVRRMSVDHNGVEGVDPSPSGFKLGSINPTVSADGRYVVFASLAANLSKGDSAGRYEGDAATATANIAAGAVTGFVVTSGGSGYSQWSPPLVVIYGGGGSGATAAASVDAAGVVTAINLLNGGSGYTSAPTVIIASDANNALDIFIHDRDAGGSGTLDGVGNTTTEMVSVNTFGYQTMGLLGIPSTAASNIYPVISANGRYVAFPSDAENTAGLAFGATNLLSLDSNAVRDVFLGDRRINALPNPTTPPVVTITSPGNGSTNLVNTAIPITASATTTVGVVSSVQFYVNGTSIGISSTFPYTQTWTPTAVGTYTLSAMVTDSFGNLGISSNVTVTIVAAPSVGITNPVAGATITVGAVQTVTAVAAASNPGATITSVQFRVNGIALGAAIAPPAPLSVAWTPASTGTFTLTAVATDSLGTQTVSPGVTVTVVPAGGGGGGGGPTPPTVTITAPAGGTTSNVNIPLMVTATATLAGGTVTTVEFFANGVAIGSATSYPYTITWTPVTPGTYALTALATGDNGGQATSTPNTITVSPGTAPSVTISSPAAGTSVGVGTPQIIVANATAASGTIASVQFLLNGIPLGTSTTFPYNQPWTPTATGAVAITAVATDTLGNKTTSAPANVTVTSLSAGAPSVSITSPAGGAALPVGVATPVVVSASATNGSIVSVEFFANGLPFATATSFPFTADFTPSSPGVYVLTARATDNGGGIGVSAPVSVTVSAGTAPSVAITAPAAGATLPVNTPYTITASASSTTGVISQVAFFVNGVAIGTKTSFPYSVSWTPGAPGSYSLTARATDNIGNITTSAPVLISVTSGTPPTVSITNPTAGSTIAIGSTQVLTVNATAAAGATIRQVQFLANGTALGDPVTTYPYVQAWTPAALGSYTLTAVATDSLGNETTSAAVAVTVVPTSTSLPWVYLTSTPTNTNVTVATPVFVSANAGDPDGQIASVAFYVNSQLIGSKATAPYFTSWVPATAGSYVVSAVAIDQAGNSTTSTTSTLTAVNATGYAPFASLAFNHPTVDTPAAGAPPPTVDDPFKPVKVTYGSKLILSAGAVDQDGTINNVQFFVNGTKIATVNAAPFLTVYQLNTLADVVITAIVTDSSNNSVYADPILIETVASGAALDGVVTLVSPADGSTYVEGGQIIFEAAHNFGTLNPPKVDFYVDGGQFTTVIPPAGATLSTPYRFTAGLTRAGTYVIHAVARVNDTTTVSSPARITVVPNTAPTVTLTAPANGSSHVAGSAVTLSASASDSDGTVASVQFFVNGSELGTAITSLPYRTTWTPSAEGIFRITATATDNAGASTSSPTSTVLVISTAAAKGVDRVYSGPFSGMGESGRFAVIVTGTTATFVGFSTIAPGTVYYFPNLTVDAAGGFAGTDSAGRTISGAASETGISVMLNGQTLLIGIVADSSGTGPVPAGHYTGSLAGVPGSALDTIVGSDGSVAIYLNTGTAADTVVGTLTSAGTASLTSAVSGSRFNISINANTGFLSGTITGANAGTMIGALSSGAAFSDGTLRNLSTRGHVGTGDNILIAGFYVGGNTPKQVLVRAIGPTLTNYGVTGELGDPYLRLLAGSTVIATNDNWGGAANIVNAALQVGAFALPAASRDAVVLTTLSPGLYSAQVSGVAGVTGVALVEVWDVDSVSPFSSQKVMNVSTRGIVGVGQAQLIAGFVVSGNIAKKVLIRAVGPSLTTTGVTSGYLADPMLTLTRNENGVETLVRENNDWPVGNDASLVASASTAVGAFPLLANGKDAVILITLPPGVYTAQATGANSTTGLALIEVYEVP